MKKILLNNFLQDDAIRKTPHRIYEKHDVAKNIKKWY